MQSNPVALFELARARLAVNILFFVCGASFSNWLARIPSVRERLALGEKNLGLVLLGTAIGAMLAFRVAGRLIARFGSQKVAACASVAFCLLIQLPAHAPTAWWAFAGLFILGCSSGLMDVGMNAQAVEVERRCGRSILSTFHGVFSLGGLVGATTGSMAAAHGISPSTHLGVMGIILVPPVLWAGGQLISDDTERAPDKAAPVFNRALFALGLVAFCSSVGEGAMADWTAVYLRDVLHTGLGTAALGYAAFSVAMLVGRFTGDRITSAFGPERVVRLGGLLVALGLGAGLMVNTLWSMIVGVVCVGLGLSQAVPVVFRAGGRMPGVPRAAALSTLATLSYTGFLVGPPAIGLISEYATLRGGLAVVSALALVLSVLAPSVRVGQRPATPGDKTA